MNERESRTLLRAALVLLAAGAVRWAIQGGAPASDMIAAGAAGAVGTVGATGAASDLAALDSAARAAAEAEARAATPLGAGERLDPNRVDRVELERLPGVGPAMAEAIVRSREDEGPFTSAADLERVRGIGPTTAAKLETHLDFSAAPPARPLVRGGARETRSREGPPASGDGQPARSPASGARVDLNRASASELEALPGVGPVLARRIVESRQRDGPFRRAEELLRVSGIGPAVLERLRARVTPQG